MPPKKLDPRKSLTKGFLKLKPKRADFDRFRAAAVNLLASVKEGESEEFHKNLIADFLKQSFYSPRFYINTKGYSDLVIHNGKSADTSVGVILEVKSPTNRSGMPREDHLDSRALQELVLYFLRERVTANNLELRALVITNLDEWFIFDAAEFEDSLISNKALIRRFTEFENQALSGRSTDFFYKEIASPAIAAAEHHLVFTHFLWSDYNLAGSAQSESRRLVDLYKLLSPEHLLKIPFSTDSQSLDRAFYSELLHIIGLEEETVSGRKLILRKSPDERHLASLLENTIAQVIALDKLSQITDPMAYGASAEDQLFNISLQLVITWIDRIIFLKLLEAQLIRYHGGDRSFAFLTKDNLKSFNDLNTLFFSVLAKRREDRPAELQDLYGQVPYLNSSLFDPASIEHDAIFVSNLDDGRVMPVFRSSALRDSAGDRLSGNLEGLDYVLRFLDAYDFGTEGTDEIQEENKTLIDASVLGLIFEKINGYRDGSFFTPGPVTMYMCRESVRRTVLDKFNGEYGWNCPDINGLFDKITDKAAANSLVNSIRICDPAVGSGHFLVSALNEILTLKSDLKILVDKRGRTLRDYDLEVVNDDLVITNEEGNLFTYVPHNKESQIVQETIFREKQTIIENCLFGVDINANSAKICRLRLWIELLKSSYYKPDGDGRDLETLPNIDINIKTGDSLMSRYPLSTSLSGIVRASRRSVADYRAAISAYQGARSREDKRQFEELINLFRREFGAEIRRQNVDDLKGELKRLEDQVTLFEEKGEKAADTKTRKRKLSARIEEGEATVAASRLYKSAFEWRLEFPQVLDSAGTFAGFDLIIVNPPYGLSLEADKRNFIEARLGKVPDHEIFYMFINLARTLLKAGGQAAFIVPNTVLFNVYAKNYRLGLLELWELEEVADCTEFRIFADATVRNVILSMRKAPPGQMVGFIPTADVNSLGELLNRDPKFVDRTMMVEQVRNWALVFLIPEEVLAVVARIQRSCRPLAESFPDVSQGLIAYDKLRGQTAEVIRSRARHSMIRKNSNFKEWLRGEDIRPYQVSWNGQEFIEYGDIGEGIANPRQPKFFRGPRILVREITSPRIYAGYTAAEQYNDPAIINILGPGEGGMPIYCLLGILNSRLATFYHRHSSPKSTKGEFPKILVADINEFPLPGSYDLSVCEDVSRLAQEISDSIAAGLQSAPTPEMAHCIDDLVYRLYGLPSEDIAVIEREMNRLEGVETM